MAEIYAPVAIATATTLMTTILLLSRASIHGRRPAVLLMRRWIGASARTSGVLLAVLSAITVLSLMRIDGQSNAIVASAPAGSDPTSDTGDSPDPDGAFAALKSYADNVDAKSQRTPAASGDANQVALPDVDTMIAKLVARLEKDPNDVKGWKMLGWSYLNTGRADDALTAYQTALKIQPADPEIAKALEQAKTAQRKLSGGDVPGRMETAKAADDLSDAQRDTMIRDMIEQLATRLQASPRDEGGWLRLMQSRMTLGEKEAAKIALTKALEAFADDDAAKSRLTAAARELGIESYESSTK
jgi:cytochrome c-type biogenesis protein CcmH